MLFGSKAGKGHTWLTEIFEFFIIALVSFLSAARDGVWPVEKMIWASAQSLLRWSLTL